MFTTAIPCSAWCEIISIFAHTVNGDKKMRRSLIGPRDQWKYLLMAGKIDIGYNGLIYVF